MEQHIIKHKDEFNCQELSNLLYSYFKAENASADVLKELIPTVISKMDHLKPKELTCLLVAYTEEGFFGDRETGLKNAILLRQFEN